MSKFLDIVCLHEYLPSLETFSDEQIVSSNVRYGWTNICEICWVYRKLKDLLIDN